MATSVKPIRRANVTRVTTAGVYVTIPTISPSAEIGPMDAASIGLAVGDRVIVGQAGNEQESWVLLTKLAANPIGVPTPFIYSFATVADRDDIFDGVPANMVSPTFAWVEDTMALYVWTTTDDAWHQVSWDEDRVVAIEDDVETLFTETTAIDVRLDNLEAFGVTDSATIDFTLSGTSIKNLTASVKVDSITLDNLSGVAIVTPATGEGIRYNGTGWVNARFTADDLSDVVISSPATAQVIRYNGTNWVNAALSLDDLSDVAISSPAVNQAVVHNGTNFVNRGIPLGLIWNHFVNSATTFASNFASETDWYSISITTLVANRSYRLHNRIVLRTGSGQAVKCYAYIKAAGTTIAHSGSHPVGSDNADVAFEVSCPYNTGASPGTVTFAVGAARFVGVSNIDMVARTDNPAWFYIEDLGPVRSD